MKSARFLFLGALLALTFTAPAASSQESRVVRGRVRDAVSKLAVADAVVRQLGDVTNAVRSATDGRFALRLPTGAALIVARLGFAPDTVSVPTAVAALEIDLRAAPLTVDPVLVSAERSFGSASSFTIRQLDIALRPRESSQELLRLAPGLVIAQHAGGGKAEQIFFRGFDADHGTDVAIRVDGTPVNLVSHAHGQGYADLHFLMPEVIASADVRKGPFDARDGDFATAGAVDFRTRERVDGAVLSARGGTFETAHLVGLAPLGGDADHAGGYIAGSLHKTNGPFDAPQGYRRANAFAKWTAPVSSAQLVATASGFDSRWDASGQLPERAVQSGAVDRFGSLDPTEGGNTFRYDASIALRSRGDAAHQWEARAYAARYRLDLFSNFTFFAADSLHGDGIEQRDDRLLGGVQLRYGQATGIPGLPGHLDVGLESRFDAANVALYRQERRTRLGTTHDADIREAHSGLWLTQSLAITRQLRAELGVRADFFQFGVSDRAGADNSVSGPSRAVSLISPKLNLAFDLDDHTTLFADAGTGFHSNDARDVVAARAGEHVLPRAVSAEIGMRRSWTGGSLALSAWRLDLQSELVWSGDAGGTEASGRTSRVGADAEARVRLEPWLWAEADLSLAHGRFVDEPRGMDRVPLAPTLVASGGLVARGLGAFDGSLRVRHVSSRAANEDASVTALGHTVWETSAGWNWRHARAFATVDNLFNIRWNEAQFATTSRLRGESAAVTELHFTPGAPRSVQLGVEYRF